MPGPVAAAKAVGVELADTADKTWGNALYACFDQKVEEKLIQPTFITRYPVEVSPLTKRAPPIPGSRSGSSCLSATASWPTPTPSSTIPSIKESGLKSRWSSGRRGDDETEMLDEDFLTALEYGHASHRRHGHGHRPLRHDAHRRRHHPGRHFVPDDEAPRLRNPCSARGCRLFQHKEGRFYPRFTPID